MYVMYSRIHVCQEAWRNVELNRFYRSDCQYARAEAKMEKAPNADYNACVCISNPEHKVKSVYFSMSQIRWIIRSRSSIGDFVLKLCVKFGNVGSDRFDIKYFFFWNRRYHSPLILIELWFVPLSRSCLDRSHRISSRAIAENHSHKYVSRPSSYMYVKSKHFTFQTSPLGLGYWRGIN